MRKRCRLRDETVLRATSEQPRSWQRGRAAEAGPQVAEAQPQVAEAGPQVTAAAALGQLRQTKDQLESSLQEECMVMEELQRRSNDLQHRCGAQGSGRVSVAGFEGFEWRSSGVECTGLE